MQINLSSPREGTLPLAVHLVPYDGVGGVEVAARTTLDGAYEGFIFSKCYLLDAADATLGVAGSMRGVLDRPSVYWRALVRVLRLRPALVVASLWRSCVVAVAVKSLRPRTKVVTFLHLASDVHALDKWLNLLCMALSSEIWADSQATLDARVPKKFKAKTRIISFMVQRQLPTSPRAPTPRFVFWGRLHVQKDLVRALRIFSAVHSFRADAEFSVIGPDGGALLSLKGIARELGLESAVHFLGPLERDEIFKFARSCSFYLQTSVVEGMAMSVIEAMQLGLVPIVTPVGEIGTYCEHLKNSLIVDDDAAVVETIISLLDDVQRYLETSTHAMETWTSRPVYREDFLRSCARLLSFG